MKLILVILGVLVASAAHAQNAPWCLQPSGDQSLHCVRVFAGCHEVTTCDHELIWTIRLQCLHCVADVFQRYNTAESTIIVLDGHGKLWDGLPSLLD